MRYYDQVPFLPGMLVNPHGLHYGAQGIHLRLNKHGELLPSVDVVFGKSEIGVIIRVESAHQTHCPWHYVTDLLIVVPRGVGWIYTGRVCRVAE